MYLAHAFGQRYELPIPLLLFVIGGAAIVIVSFLVVAPNKVTSDDRDWPDESPVGPPHPVAGTIGVVALAAVIACRLFGSQELAENMVPTLFWVVGWIAVPLSCGLVGDWTRPLNPFAVLARLADRPGLRRALLGGADPVPWRFGWWPAVALFFLTACGELVFNVTVTVPAHTALALLVYAVVSAAGGLLFGDAWLRRGELFTVLLSTWGRLGHWRFGAPGRRGLGGGLRMPFAATASRICFVLLLLVSVNFDGLLATPAWNRLERRLPGALPAHEARLEGFRTLTFIALAAAIALAFGALAVAAYRAGRQRVTYRTALTGLLPSLLPIAFGYLLAHNLQYLAVNGQLLAPLIGNPIGRESWPIHLPYPFNDDYQVHPQFLPSAAYWYASVIVIIAVHVVAVAFAHRHLAAQGADVRSARASEYPWLAAMVAYTMLSLWLIAQPLVQEKQASQEAAGPAAVTVVGRA
jgi:hypothetical protein